MKRKFQLFSDSSYRVGGAGRLLVSFPCKSNLADYLG